MKQHYKSDEESIKESGIGFGFSDPTPALPMEEGVSITGCKRLDLIPTFPNVEGICFFGSNQLIGL